VPIVPTRALIALLASESENSMTAAVTGGNRYD
jgi:hypothetical protein